MKTLFSLVAVLSCLNALASPERARDLGIPFEGTPGQYNAITDIPGVEVGQVTLIIGDGPHAIRTGVTAVLPAGKTQSKLPASTFDLNGNGEMTGAHWVDEGGFLEGPILTTNTYSIGTVDTAVRKWGEKNFPNNDMDKDDAFMLPIVAETYDGYLNDIKGMHVKEEHAFEALDSAKSGPVDEGGVGGGTGMMCLDFKCGIGTASRIVTASGHDYVVGVLVQANFGDRADLRIAGIPVGKEIPDLMPDNGPLADGTREAAHARSKDGSIIIVVGTNAPLLPDKLHRLVKHAALGLARDGGMAYDSSGDLFIAFSTAAPTLAKDGLETWRNVPNEELHNLVQGVVWATEEAIVNALVAGKTMKGVNGTTVYGLPHDRMRALLKKYSPR